jgi:RNA-directed DNA polymerase
MLEQITRRHNLWNACLQVISNGGSSGVDGMQTDELRDYFSTHYAELCASIHDGSYIPQAVRQVSIPKAQGGTRMLGIPTVIDRMIQQAISQWLMVGYEQNFSNNSFGFRPRRNCKQAVYKAQQYLQEGKTWIVELDLEKFFDTVNHDKLMSLLALTITDTRVLKLIRLYLRSGIMVDGTVSQRIEGTPQGSPLSPLLSNIILNELDKELAQRGLSFVRYADDCSIYVKSAKSAQRVLTSITKYIEQKLLLKVNQTKSKISRPTSSSLLGFSFYRNKKEWSIRILPKKVSDLKRKCKRIVRRNNGMNIQQKIDKLAPIVRGWVNYFNIADADTIMQTLDRFIRIHLRMSQWKEWKSCRTRVKNLIQLGINKGKAYEWGNSSKGYCRVAHSPILSRTLTNMYFTKRGYVGFSTTYKLTKSMQTSLF